MLSTSRPGFASLLAWTATRRCRWSMSGDGRFGERRRLFTPCGAAYSASRMRRRVTGYPRRSCSLGNAISTGTASTAYAQNGYRRIDRLSVLDRAHVCVGIVLATIASHALADRPCLTAGGLAISPPLPRSRPSTSRPDRRTSRKLRPNQEAAAVLLGIAFGQRAHAALPLAPSIPLVSRVPRTLPSTFPRHPNTQKDR